jgi:hypothetical protein
MVALIVFYLLPALLSGKSIVTGSVGWDCLLFTIGHILLVIVAPALLAGFIIGTKKPSIKKDR